MIGLWATLAECAAVLNWAILGVFLVKVIGAKNDK